MDFEIMDTETPAKACVIWMHGLGADANDMKGLASALHVQEPVRHVCLNAPVRPVTINQHMSMRAWYDITGVGLTNREDKQGILDSEKLCLEVIRQQKNEGIDASKIFLAGFSQGGAMALFTGLRYPNPIAGIIALSAYLPLARTWDIKQDTHTPIFMALGQFDEIVLPQWSQQSIDLIKKDGFQDIQDKSYPMAHEVCMQELRDLSSWFDTNLQRLNRMGEKT